ncbi:hypothetical protein EDD16DRAFT_1528981 [Pisolithus croceorrhizus]|nr:hypothetical protein EDD16DRAFT_1528981 [Pisolithus croceorrhizus]KAI6168036.1 hypothetical protein EDD17DRAFT_1503697 [Pisolithus thermaeus]
MSTVPHMAPMGSIGHIPTQSTPLGKGKGVDPSEQKVAKVAMVEVVLIPLEDDNRDMSKVIEEDIEMDDIEPACGRSQKQGWPTSKFTKGQKEHYQQGGRHASITKSFAFTVWVVGSVIPAESTR